MQKIFRNYHIFLYFKLFVVIQLFLSRIANVRNIVFIFFPSGYIGIVKDATESLARVELHTNCKTISVDRNRLSVVRLVHLSLGPVRLVHLSSWLVRKFNHLFSCYQYFLTKFRYLIELSL